MQPMSCKWDLASIDDDDDDDDDGDGDGDGK